MLLIHTLIACVGDGKTKKHIPFVDYSSDYTETIDIPFRDEGGVKMVVARINGASIDMIFDTGCSETLISLLEAELLFKRGLLSGDDYLGSSQSVIANGEIVDNMMFNIKTLELSDGNSTIICTDVLVSVSTNIEAPVLLGNGVLDRVASYEIDNENRLIKFKLK